MFPVLVAAFVVWLCVALWTGAGEPRSTATGDPDPLSTEPAESGPPHSEAGSGLGDVPEPSAGARSLASLDDGWQRVTGGGNAAETRWPASNPWIRRWTVADGSIHPALSLAGRIFGVSYGWLHACVHSEGGHVSARKLRRALRWGTQPGWNTAGSYAFGPFQFMLSEKPAPRATEWGTFGAYAEAAFTSARLRGQPVPYRFRRPDSNVGQAVVAAFMFSHGHSGQWTGAGC